jgi:hypothetical protein
VPDGLGRRREVAPEGIEERFAPGILQFLIALEHVTRERDAGDFASLAEQRFAKGHKVADLRCRIAPEQPPQEGRCAHRRIRS